MDGMAWQPHLHATAVIIMCVLSMLWMKLGGKALRCRDLSHWQLSGASLDTTWQQQQQQHRQGQQQGQHQHSTRCRVLFKTVQEACVLQLHRESTQTTACPHKAALLLLTKTTAAAKQRQLMHFCAAALPSHRKGLRVKHSHSNKAVH
jgi:hypothetical protein